MVGTAPEQQARLPRVRLITCYTYARTHARMYRRRGTSFAATNPPNSLRPPLLRARRRRDCSATPPLPSPRQAQVTRLPHARGSRENGLVFIKTDRTGGLGKKRHRGEERNTKRVLSCISRPLLLHRPDGWTGLIDHGSDR